MALITSAKGANMPAVENATADIPRKVGRHTFVVDGQEVTLKMTDDEAAAYQKNLDEQHANRLAWQRLTAGIADEPAAERESDVVPLTVLKKDELVALAEARGLKTSGSKADIAARFIDGAADDDSDDQDPDAGQGGTDPNAGSGTPPA